MSQKPKPKFLFSESVMNNIIMQILFGERVSKCRNANIMDVVEMDIPDYHEVLRETNIIQPERESLYNLLSVFITVLYTHGLILYLRSSPEYSHENKLYRCAVEFEQITNPSFMKNTSNIKPKTTYTLSFPGITPGIFISDNYNKTSDNYFIGANSLEFLISASDKISRDINACKLFTLPAATVRQYYMQPEKSISANTVDGYIHPSWMLYPIITGINKDTQMLIRSRSIQSIPLLWSCSYSMFNICKSLMKNNLHICSFELDDLSNLCVEQSIIKLKQIDINSDSIESETIGNLYYFKFPISLITPINDDDDENKDAMQKIYHDYPYAHDAYVLIQSLCTLLQRDDEPDAKAVERFIINFLYPIQNQNISTLFGLNFSGKPTYISRMPMIDDVLPNILVNVFTEFTGTTLAQDIYTWIKQTGLFKLIQVMTNSLEPINRMNLKPPTKEELRASMIAALELRENEEKIAVDMDYAKLYGREEARLWNELVEIYDTMTNNPKLIAEYNVMNEGLMEVVKNNRMIRDFIEQFESSQAYNLYDDSDESMEHLKVLVSTKLSNITDEEYNTVLSILTNRIYVNELEQELRSVNSWLKKVQKEYQEMYENVIKEAEIPVARNTQELLNTINNKLAENPHIKSLLYKSALQ